MFLCYHLVAQFRFLPQQMQTIVPQTILGKVKSQFVDGVLVLLRTKVGCQGVSRENFNHSGLLQMGEQHPPS